MESRLVRKHFVEFLFPGVLVSEHTSRQVADRDPAKVKVPKGAYCFSFYDQIVGVAIENGQKIPVSSGALDPSPKYYYGGEVYSAAELKQKFPDHRTLISNIEDNGYERAIKCRTGSWQPLEETDVVLEVA